MKRRYLATTALIIVVSTTGGQEINLRTSNVSSGDAVVAASQSHDVIFEDDNIRLLSVTIPAGGSAPIHHHELPSVLIIDSYARATEELAGGVRVMSEVLPAGAQVPFVLVRGPQAAHTISNTDMTQFHLYRLEFKNLQFQNLRRETDQRQEQTR